MLHLKDEEAGSVCPRAVSLWLGIDRTNVCGSIWKAGLSGSAGPACRRRGGSRDCYGCMFVGVD